MVDLSSLPALRTERLDLRPVHLADLGLLVELNSDPAVMTHIRGRAATPAETRAEWSQRLEHQSCPERGLGYWLGLEDGHFVGWWSASYYAPQPDMSGIGYRLCQAAWGQGLATEGAGAMVEQAFADPGIDRIFASILAVNSGSRRVLEKIEMTQTSAWTKPPDTAGPGSDIDHVGYELTRDEWSRKDS